MALRTQLVRGAELVTGLERLLLAPDEGGIYWISTARRTAEIVLHSAPCTWAIRCKSASLAKRRASSSPRRHCAPTTALSISKSAWGSTTCCRWRSIRPLTINRPCCCTCPKTSPSPTSRITSALSSRPSSSWCAPPRGVRWCCSPRTASCRPPIVPARGCSTATASSSTARASTAHVARSSRTFATRPTPC